MLKSHTEVVATTFWKLRKRLKMSALYSMKMGNKTEITTSITMSHDLPETYYFFGVLLFCFFAFNIGKHAYTDITTKCNIINIQYSQNGGLIFY